MTHFDALLIMTVIGAVISLLIAWGVGKIDLSDKPHDHDQPATSAGKK